MIAYALVIWFTAICFQMAVCDGFHLQKIPINTKPHDPFFLEFHMTRYTGGCLRLPTLRTVYNTVVPWIRHFDVIISMCGTDWKGDFHGGADICAFGFDDNDHMHDRNHTIERVHVQPDNRFNKHFQSQFLPHYEAEFRRTGKQILLHIGTRLVHACNLYFIPFPVYIFRTSTLYLYLIN